jgi:enoyl-CoA hydratase/carnithine racemase
VSQDQGSVSLRIEGAVALITFDRPAAHNAMTWAMYEALAEACGKVNADKTIRVAVLRGAGGKAFISGTDISQFSAFASGEDGLAYEAKVDHYVETVERLRVPSIAAVEGYAVGGGLAIANACDLRIATQGARFGVPIARTLGNCLSAANIRRLCATLGVAWVKRMLLLAEMPTAEMLQPLGYVTAIVSPDALDAEIGRSAERLSAHAPLTMAATRETLRRLAVTPEPDIADLIRACYGSADFHHGVEAFAAKQQAVWQGN